MTTTSALAERACVCMGIPVSLQSLECETIAFSIRFDNILLVERRHLPATNKQVFFHVHHSPHWSRWIFNCLFHASIPDGRQRDITYHHYYAIVQFFSNQRNEFQTEKQFFLPFQCSLGTILVRRINSSAKLNVNVVIRFDVELIAVVRRLWRTRNTQTFIVIVCLQKQKPKMTAHISHIRIPIKCPSDVPFNYISSFFFFSFLFSFRNSGSILIFCIR